MAPEIPAAFFPPGWVEAIKAGVFRRDALIVLSVRDTLALHKLVLLATWHLDVTHPLLKLSQQLLTELEKQLEDAGLPEPPAGWRLKARHPI